MKQRGFTLIEIMIALGIFALVAVMVSTALFGIFNARDRIKLQNARLARIQYALTIMEHDLQQIVPDHPKRFVAGLIGSTTEIVFTHAGYINPDSAEPRSTLQRLHYRVESGKLIRSVWESPEANEPSLDHILLKDVDKIELTYLTQLNKTVKQWPYTDSKKSRSNPRAILLILTLKDAGTVPMTIVLDTV